METSSTERILIFAIDYKLFGNFENQRWENVQFQSKRSIRRTIDCIYLRIATYCKNLFAIRTVIKWLDTVKTLPGFVRFHVFCYIISLIFWVLHYLYNFFLWIKHKITRFDCQAGYTENRHKQTWVVKSLLTIALMTLAAPRPRAKLRKEEWSNVCFWYQGILYNIAINHRQFKNF